DVVSVAVRPGRVAEAVHRRRAGSAGPAGGAAGGRGGNRAYPPPPWGDPRRRGPIESAATPRPRRRAAPGPGPEGAPRLVRGAAGVGVGGGERLAVRWWSGEW